MNRLFPKRRGRRNTGALVYIVITIFAQNGEICYRIRDGNGCLSHGVFTSSGLTSTNIMKVSGIKAKQTGDFCYNTISGRHKTQRHKENLFVN